MALKPLKVVIGGDTSQLDKALDRAKQNIKGFAVAAGAAAVAAAGGLAVLTRRGLDSVDAMAKLSRSMDSSINGLRAVQLAASEAGVSVADADASLQNLSRELVRARDAGTPAAKALAAIGMEARDLEGLDADERMAAIADRMREMGLSAGEASAVLRDLGVRSKQMSLLLIQGGDAIRGARDAVRDFGLEISQEQAGAIESANDAIARMGLVFEGLRQELAVEVAPILQKLADRFNDLAKTSLTAAVERVSRAFGNLSEVILQPEFIEGVAGAFAGLANFTAGAAEAFVTASQNVELLTIAFGGLAIAIAAVGGPITLLAGALAAALTGISTWRKRLSETKTAAESAKDAQKHLNDALGTFSDTGAPSAASEAIGYARDLQTQAMAALAAAEAELALHRAEGARIQDMIDNGHLRNLSMEEQARLSAKEHRLTTQLTEATRDLENARRTVAGLSIGEAARNVVKPPRPGIDEDDDTDPDDDFTFDLGSGADQMASRLEALRQGLMTERELLEEWRAEQEELINEATDRELEALGGRNEAKLRLEEEYNRRLMQIKQKAADSDIAITVGAGETVLNALGKFNDKALKAAKVFGAARALVSTYQGAAKALELPFPQNLAAAATVISQGLGFISSINSAGASAGGGAGAAGGGAAAAAAAPQQPGQNIVIDFQGDTFSRQGGIALIEQINDAIRDGGRIEGIMAR